MSQQELDEGWPRWPYRAAVRLAHLDDAVNLARWFRNTLGDREDRYRLQVVALDSPTGPWPHGHEIVIHTRDPEDHALVLLVWC